MSDFSTDNKVGVRLREWDKDYRLEADVIRCVHCERELHFAHAANTLPHRTGCKIDGSEIRPWRALRTMLSQIEPQPSDPTIEQSSIVGSQENG